MHHNLRLKQTNRQDVVDHHGNKGFVFTDIAARDINSKGENYFALFNDPAYGRCMLVFTPNVQILEGMKPRLNKELMLRLFYNKKV